MDSDAKLSEILRKWEGVQPRAGFEASVLRRLHAGAPAGNAWSEAFDRLHNWFSSSMLPYESAGALAGIAAGLFLALTTMSPSAAPNDARFRILHPAGLAGGYAHVVAGGGR